MIPSVMTDGLISSTWRISHSTRWLLFPASYLLPPASCLLFPASCFLPPTSCLLPPASCLLPPLYSPVQGGVGAAELPGSDLLHEMLPPDIAMEDLEYEPLDDEGAAIEREEAKKTEAAENRKKLQVGISTTSSCNFIR